MQKHLRHETVRLANEVIRHKGRTLVATANGVLPKGMPYVPGMHAVGTLAYASIYGLRDGVAPKEGAPWYVERRHKGVWITASRTMQGRTLEEARAICRACKGYRLVVRNNLGAYSPERVR